MRSLHAGQSRESFGAEKIPYAVHPLIMACQAHAMGVRQDEVLAACLLHDVCEDCGVEPDELPFSQEVRDAVRLLTKRKERFMELGRQAANDEYYRAIRSNRTAMLVKCLDRCGNLSAMATAFTAQRMVRYIEETETYVLPLLEEMKNRFLDLDDAAFLLKYQILSLLETQKALLKKIL